MSFFSFILKYSRIFTLLVIVLPLVAGVVAYQNMPKEGSPEIAVPIAFVSTFYMGASPEEIENLVTGPIEEALADISELEDLDSFSAPGMSMVVAQFETEADMENMIQKVRDKVAKARKFLPSGIEEPEVTEINVSDIPIMIISVVGDLSPSYLKRLAEDVADEIKMMPEVLGTDITGGLTREIQIVVDPDRLEQYGLTLLEVAGAVNQADVSIPGGQISISGRKYSLRTLTEVVRVKDYEKVPLLERGGKVVFLGDVAEIIDGYNEEISYSRVSGRPSVSIAVKKRPGANILESASKIREKVKELEKGFPAGVEAVVTADQSKFIKQGFDAMTNSALSGLVVVVMVLFFALGLRNSIITSFSIPLTLLITFIFLNILGISNNDIVRFSLVLCIGLLVDNAIIVVENVYHHHQLGKDRITAVIEGTAEVALPVISATLTTISAFLPLLLMSGVMGSFLGYMPKTVAVTLGSSLLVALVANPIILSRFMKQNIKHGKVVSPDEDLKWLKKVYVKFLILALNNRFMVVLVVLTGLVSVGMVFGFGILKTEMFPEGDFDIIYTIVETPPGTGVEFTNSVATRIEDIINENVPESVRAVTAVGFKGASAFELSFQGKQSNYAEITIELTDSREVMRATDKEIKERLKPLVEHITGAKIRFRSINMGPPTGAAINLKIFGNDLDELKRISADVQQILGTIKGAVEVKDDFTNAAPELTVHVDRKKAASLGVPLIGVSQVIRAATAGIKIREFRDEEDVSRKYDLILKYPVEARNSMEMFDKIGIRSVMGRIVPLTAFATVSQGPGVNVLRHSDRRRVVNVTGVNFERSAVEITKELKEKLKNYELPPGYNFSYEGDWSGTKESFDSLKLAYIVAFILILAILVAQFNSFFQPFAIMAALPLSIVGGVVGLLLTGNNFTIMSFIGLVGLTGIVVNDSIVLVDRINSLRKKGLNIHEAIINAGRDRLRPIISTTLTTIGGLLALTLTDQMWEGLGVIIIFGIAFATVLTLVVVPVMYTLFDGLGYHLSTSFYGPRWADIPKKGGYYNVRGRGVLIKATLIIIFQAAILVLGVSRFGPILLEQYAAQAIQAPTILKTVLEAFVVYVTFALEIGGLFFLLFIPSWLGLIYLRWLKHLEGYCVEVRKDRLIVSTPLERATILAGNIRRVRYNRLTNNLVIETINQKIRVRDVSLQKEAAEPASLFSWIFSAKVKRSTLKESREALSFDLEKMLVSREIARESSAVS